MKFFIIISFYLLYLISYAQTFIKLDENLYITKLKDSIYIVKHYFPWESNSLVIVTSSDIVLIDTPYEPEATAKVINWIKSYHNKNSVLAITTGFHVDNLGGNEYLKNNNFGIYGSNLTCNLIDSIGYKSLDDLISWLKPEEENIKIIYKNLKLTKPNIILENDILEKGALIKIGNYTFELYFPGPSHSPDNLTVFIKEANILFGSCIIKSKESSNLGYIKDANLLGWLDAVKKLKMKYHNTNLIIPHHGEWGDSTLFDHTINLFNLYK